MPEAGTLRSVRRLPDSPAYEIELEDGCGPQLVMKSILDAGPMRAVELRRLSLTEVFVRLVMKDAGEAAADEARQELAHA